MNRPDPKFAMYEATSNLNGFGFIIFAEIEDAIEAYTYVNANDSTHKFEWNFKGQSIAGFDKQLSGQVDFDDIVRQSLLPAETGDIERMTRLKEWHFEIVDNLQNKLNMHWFHNRYHEELSFIEAKTRNSSLRAILHKITAGGTLPKEEDHI